MIVHWRKDQQYRVIRLYQDLVGDWIVSQSSGQLHTLNGQSCQRSIFTCYQEARGCLKELNRQQRQLGFQKIGVSEEQLGFHFE